MTKAKDIVEKVEVSNVENSKSPQWDGKKLPHVEDQLQCTYDHVGTQRLSYAKVCK
jgi:hypothetical protein